AYSTLSQLGYMTVALGVSAYSASVFHLMTHAFFKALLFLAAGSVIIGMHHEQDMRRMGGLRKYMPVTFWTSLVGTLALIGTPFFAGFYSKDSIIDAAKLHAEQGGFIAQYGYYAVLLGAFVTSFYSFRLLYLTFFGKERFREVAHDAHHDDHAHGHDDHGHAHEPHESPWVVTLPLILLAIPSIIIGYLTIGPMLHGKTMAGEEAGKSFFDGSIQLPEHGVMAKLGEEFHGSLAMALHGFMQWPFILTLAGFLLATWMYLIKPEVAAKARKTFALPVRILEDKYGFDKLWINGFAGGSVLLGRISRWFDSRVIDDYLVNGAARETREVASEIRRMQTGYLYSYAFAMIVGLILLLAWLIKSGAGA
ncbi:MAG: NADH-quinone oxidoreductase subunit L, partial [Proteobacteria bacterium]|nr:NADH-quinone oxidoreductase subunit L [Pseudomonadota bacterium]